MKIRNHTRLLATGAFMASALALASVAQAQYMWIDEKGLKQLSDRPPPPTVPQKHILKAPRGVPFAGDMPAELPAHAPAPEQAKPQAQPQTLAERNADFRKRAKEQEERERKDMAADAEKTAKAENCERARNYKRSMDSGVRVNTTDKNGERGYLSDEQRAAEAARADKALAGCS